jgi:hypothetical protein
VLENVRGGLRYLGQNAAMRWTVVLTILVVAMGNLALGILVSAWVSDVLDLGAEAWGRLALFWGAGGVLLNIALMVRGEYQHKGMIFIGGAALFGLSVLGVSGTRNVGLTAAGFLLAGMGAQTVLTVSNAIAQSVVPARLLGRVMGLLWLAQGVAQGSGLFVGLLGQAVGLTVLYPLVGLLMLSAAAITLLRSPLRSLP